MSVICNNDLGWVVSHSEYINSVYKSLNLEANEEMFAVNTPYMTDIQALKLGDNMSLDSSGLSEKAAVRPRKKRKMNSVTTSEYEPHVTEVNRIQEIFPTLVTEAKRWGYFQFVASAEDIKKNNSGCRKFAARVFEQSTLDGACSPFEGGNSSPRPIVASVRGQSFALPPLCAFHCRDVAGLGRGAPGGTFQLAVVDPPWWNKYIRRRRAADRQSSYSMLRTEDLVQMDLKSLLAPGALVAVWCTNSQSHISDVHEQLFPAWGVVGVATWFWVKVDRAGKPVCPFSTPPGKQPYERVIFGRRPPENGEVVTLTDPPDGKVVVSVPSAVHSHKPPLLDLLRPHLPAGPRALEVFARSLLPHTVSWGLEVLKLQHLSLFTPTAHCRDPSPPLP